MVQWCALLGDGDAPIMRSQQPLLPSCDDDAAEVEEDAESDDDERGNKEIVVSPPSSSVATEVATASLESAAA
jgi:hypothetical protein